MAHPIDSDCGGWVIDLDAQLITHRATAFRVQFEGDPTSNDCEGKPSKFPAGITALEQVRLLREAYDAYIKAFESRSKVARATSGKSRPAAEAPPAVSRKLQAGKPTLRLNRSEKPAVD
ncbi:Hypothetical protein HDN1F_10210 [gamma proteobacterium HdN1]|nr:Hypothetical protein HDN1F_10210 [gamma proteobacterium HdN1]